MQTIETNSFVLPAHLQLSLSNALPIPFGLKFQTDFDTFKRLLKRLASELEDPGSSPETTNFPTNICGQATINALVSLFTKQCKLVQTALASEG